MSLVDLVKHFEGFHRVVQRRPVILAAPYLCPAGYWTLAWGHLSRPDHPPVDEIQGGTWLADDLAIGAMAVRRFIAWPLAPNQVDALTSWTMNLGTGRLQGSTLRAVINRGELERAPAEIRRWVYAGGRRLPGLVERREAEAALFIS